MNYKISEIEEITDLGEYESYVYDVGMEDSPNTFFANDILVHNSVFLQYGNILKSIDKDFKNKNKEEIISNCLKIDKQIKDKIDEKCQNIANTLLCTNEFNFETEELYDKLLITSKKKYIARKIYDKTTNKEVNEYTTKGMAFKQGYLSKNMRSFVKSILEDILNDATMDDIISKLKSKWDEIPTLPIDDISYAQGCKNIKKYTNKSKIDMKDGVIKEIYFGNHTPQHVKGAIVLNYLIKNVEGFQGLDEIMEGDKVNLIFVCPNNIFGISALAVKGEWHPKLYDFFKLDVEKIFLRDIMKPLQATFDALNWKFSLEDIIGYKLVDSENTIIQTTLF